MNVKSLCVTVHTEGPKQRCKEESLHAEWPGLQVSRADSAGGGPDFYSVARKKKKKEGLRTFAQVS